MVFDESLAIKVGKVHQKTRSGTSMLRGKVDGGRGDNYGDTVHIRQKVSKWYNEDLCLIHLQEINWNWVFHKRWEEKEPYIFQNIIIDFKPNRYIILEKSDFCKVCSYLDSVVRIVNVLIILVQHIRDCRGATHLIAMFYTRISPPKL